MNEQVLDNMEFERERGITIKAQTVRLPYKAQDGETYILNLMDTPGHVDFAYEVSRSLAACEGSLLVVDASQGVEAQTLANVYQAIEANHEIVPVLNKIDLPAAEPERVKQQIEDVIGLDASDAVDDQRQDRPQHRGRAGGASSRGCRRRRAMPRRPSPRCWSIAGTTPISAWWCWCGCRDGHLRKGQRIRMMSNGAVHTVEQVGIFTPKMVAVDNLGPGEMGYITAAIKTVADTNVGDTITDDRSPGDRGAARLQALHPGGLVRPVPGRCRRFREAARKPSASCG